MKVATEDECIELAQALEQQRALHIVAAVKVLPIGGADADMPTPLQAGYQLACEEIEYRLRTEQWEFCKTPAPLPPSTTAPCPKCGRTRLIGGTHCGNNGLPCYGLKTQNG